jgi:hypothetical protein
MQRPHVGLDNFSTVYDFYRRHEQSRAFAWFAHRALARTYKVSITADDGAEAAIDEAITAGKRVIISPNHITADDQYVIVSTAETMKSLRPLRGRAFIPAEPSLFTRSGWQGRMLRRSVDGLGALPTFRLEDLRRQGIEVTEEVKDRYQRAVVKASETQVAKLIAGHSMAGFWEGTRNRSDYRVVQPLRKGIAHTAIAAAEEVPVVVLPVGFYYGQEPEDYARPVLPDRHRPLVHVANPIEVATTDPEELVGLVHPEIQRCVDLVVERAASPGKAA